MYVEEDMIDFIQVYIGLYITFTSDALIENSGLTKSQTLNLQKDIRGKDSDDHD